MPCVGGTAPELPAGKGSIMPLRRQAEQMRDLYANEIAAAVNEGREPSALQVKAWAEYQAAAQAEDANGAVLKLHTAPEK